MRHKLISSKWKITEMILSILLTLNTVVFGVPLSMSFSNQDNIKNEHIVQVKDYSDKRLVNSSCLVNGSKYGEGEYVPGAGPCEECICHPPNVVCSMTKCPVNSGCITIQLPNKCCPKYKCDCEHKGKLYNNGEKINKSDESACRVCFCNGGEIVCTSIVCYTRNDCQGYYLPGDCCPKYDNCTSTSSIEQKSRDMMEYEKSSRKNIQYWSSSTEQNYNEDGIWKRDTTKTQQHELPTVPNIITIPSIFVETAEVSRETNRSLPDYFLEELNNSTSVSILDKNITLNEPDNELNTPHNLVTDVKYDDFNVGEDSKTTFLGFETENLTTNGLTTDISLMKSSENSETSPEFEELFDTTDIDSSVIITNQNGTETVIGITETPPIKEMIKSSTEMTISTQVEIFDQSDLLKLLDSKRPLATEFSRITPELNPITEIDNDESKEATTPRTYDQPTVGTPDKLVMENSERSIDDDISTENAFTDLEDTTDMFGPNFGHRSYKTEAYQIITNTQKADQQIKGQYYVTSYLPIIDKSSEKKTLITTEPPQNKLLDQMSTESNIENKNFTINTEFDSDNISAVTNNTSNDTYFLELETTNVTVCVNDVCTESSKLNEEQFDPQIESTTPFIIETKVLPNQEPPLTTRRIKYPKAYPAEFETIQNGPSVTITKRTYTSIPDIVYTTTTMITLPTLDLIYKADKDIDKYVNEMQTSTTNKPKTNNLSPLRNLSIISTKFT